MLCTHNSGNARLRAPRGKTFCRMLCLRKSRDPHRRLAVWLVGLSFHHMLLMAKTQTDWPPLNKSYCRRLLLSRPQSDHEGGFVVLGWFLVWLCCVLSLLLAHFFEQAHLASPSLIHYGDLCLSAHIAPLPVQKKNKSYCRHGVSVVPSSRHAHWVLPLIGDPTGQSAQRDQLHRT